MEVRSSNLDHLHLPQPGDLAHTSSDGTTQSGYGASGNQHGLSAPSADFTDTRSTTSLTRKSWVNTDGDGDVQMFFGNPVSVSQTFDEDGDGDGDGDGDVDETMNMSSPSASDDHSLGATQVPAPLPLPNTSREGDASGFEDSRRQYSESEQRAQGKKPPTLAVAFPGGTLADYRPWMGNAVEDVLNETVVRNGFSDKPSNASQSESNMARPVIWSNLKNKHGQLALSTLLIQAMDKRQIRGKCTAPSTFKPPPRVTLTDTKREAWLRDLASSSVPLRRLSRTIPHGVRNKVLLDQCLGKKVPLARAIWLVKCVGANEIRSFRRKGVSGSVSLIGELKWIKEWTICVEQFLEAGIQSAGQKDWSTNIKYTIRLVTALVDEDLLDRDHLLQWLVASFTSSTVDRLPIWVLLVQICWSHLCHVQARGRQLGEAILVQLNRLQNNLQQQSYKAIVNSLDNLFLRLAIAQPDALVAMRQWPALSVSANMMCGRQARDQARVCLQSIFRRMDRLNISSNEARRRLKTPRLRLFDYLDQVPNSTAADVIITCGQKICNNPQTLITAVVDWASTVHRIGWARVHLAIRVLHRLACSGVALETAILSCLSSASTTTQNRDLYDRIVSELVKSGDFDFGKYLQWLISSGNVSGTGLSQTSLLYNVSLSRLSPQSLTLRGIVLARSQHNAEHVKPLSALQSLLDEAFSGDMQSGDWSAVVATASTAPSSVRLAVSRSAASRLAMMQSEGQPCSIPITAFLALRALAEGANDFPSLYQLLRITIPVANFQHVANYAATIQKHSDIFSAMEVLHELTILLHKLHARLRHLHQYDKAFISSLLFLSRQQPKFRARVPSINQDLSTCEQQHAAAVCSPASDSMLAGHSCDIASDEDIDRTLASGNTMDEQLLTRLFSAIAERAVKWTVAGYTSLANPCRWFASLRMFDAAVFDRHMNSLLGKLINSAGTDQVRAIFIALVSSGCLDPGNALSAFVKRLDLLETNSAPQLARFAAGTLQTFLPLQDLDHQKLQPEIYRFQIAQHSVCTNHYKTLLRFVWHSLATANDALNCLFTSAGVAWLSIWCCNDPDAVAKALHLQERPPAPKAPRLSRLLWTMARGIAETTTTFNTDAEDMSSLSRMIRGSDELQLPFIRLLIGHTAATIASADQSVELRQAFETAIAEQSVIWPQLMDGAGSEVARSLHDHSCNAILATAADLVSERSGTSAPATIAENFKVTVITSSDNDESGIQLMEKSLELLQQAAEKLDEARDRDPAGNRAIESITGLVRLMILTVSSLPADKLTSPTPQQLLGSLCTLLARGDMQLRPQMMELLHDCSALIARSLSTDQLGSVYRRLDDNTRQHRRVHYLLGVEESETKWLVLASRVPVQTLATNSPTPVQSSFQAFSRPGTQSMPSPRSVSGPSTTSTPLPSPGSQHNATPARAPRGVATEIKYNAYPLRKWELMRDPTPNMGANDTSLSLQLFSARKVL